MGRYRDLFVKVRARLRNDPRTFRLARSLACAQTFQAWAHASLPDEAVRAIARDALVGVWQGALDFHEDRGEDDAFLPGLTLADLAGWGCPGIGTAMAAVGWAVEVDGGVVLPGYLRHNGHRVMDSTAAAERMRAHRAKKADSLRDRSRSFGDVAPCSPEGEGEGEGEKSSVPTGRAEPAAPAPPTAEAKPRKPRRQTEAAKATRVAQCIDALQAHPRLAQHAQLARFWPLAMRALAGSGRKLEPEQAETWLALADREPDRAARELELEYAAGMRSLPKLFQGGQAARAPEGAQTVDWRKKAAQAAQGRAS